ANYGVVWQKPEPPHVGTIRGNGGFNVLLDQGVLALQVRNPGTAPETVRLAVNGAPITTIDLAGGTDRAVRLTTSGLLAFVDVETTGSSGVVVDVPRREY